MRAWLNPNGLTHYESLVEQLVADRHPNPPRVLEYGSGNSTAWLERAGCTVVAIEHDPAWFQKVCAMMSPSGDSVIILRERSEYAQPPAGIGVSSEPYDFIVIDGINRLDCVKAVIDNNLLADGGFLLFDDSQRRDNVDEYAVAWELLTEAYGEGSTYHVPYRNEYGRWESAFFKNSP